MWPFLSNEVVLHFALEEKKRGVPAAFVPVMRPIPSSGTNGQQLVPVVLAGIKARHLVTNGRSRGAVWDQSFSTSWCY